MPWSSGGTCRTILDGPRPTNGDRQLIFTNGNGRPEGHFLYQLKQIAFRAGLNWSKSWLFVDVIFQGSELDPSPPNPLSPVSDPAIAGKAELKTKGFRPQKRNTVSTFD
jgi:hypothetical protein